MTHPAERPAPDVIHPATGEIIAVHDAADEQLARFLDEIRDYELRLREAKAIVNRELLTRLDHDGRWTRHAGAFTLSAPSPAPGETFDAEKLRDALFELAGEGELTVDAVHRAIRTEVVYTPVAGELKALRKLGGPVAAAIDAHATRMERKRYVKVERAPTAALVNVDATRLNLREEN
jgi:hypothetical protein